MGPIPATPALHDQTVIQVMRLSAGGERLRVRFTNAFGTVPLQIGKARIGLAGPNGAFLPGTDRPVLFNGRDSASIAPGAPMLSDPVDLPVRALAKVVIRIYLPQDTGPCTCHPLSLEPGWVTDGDQAIARGAPTGAPFASRAFVAGIDVVARQPVRSVVVLGDSLTDGYGATVGGENSWPDRLAERLNAKANGRVGVVNMGISGNRLLSFGAGESALARLDRDVLAQPGARYLVVFIGINDIGAGQLSHMTGPFADIMRSLFPKSGDLDPVAMLEGYRQIIERAHDRGMKVYGTTITPFGGAPLFNAASEAQRQAINKWIRTSAPFDAVLDFDAVWRDPAKPEQIRREFSSPDLLHGNDAGYRALADSVPLSLFN
ncbi:MAG: SGNH/GDSL hydrolase family protein [Novosphingobium sp.]